MRRREFLSVLGGAAAAWPLVARAQQAGKSRIVGFLGSATPATMGPWTTAFVQRLRELGWIERQHLRHRIPFCGGAQRKVQRTRRRVGPAQG